MAAATATWVDAAPFRAHLRHVMAVGDLTATEVATLAGVPPRMATSLLTGRRSGRAVRRISPEHARALIRVTTAHAGALRAHQLPAAESRQRLRALLARDPDLPGIATQLRVTTETLSALADGTASWCCALLALRLLALARALLGEEQPGEPDQVAA